jgi:hypothetical protein
MSSLLNNASLLLNPAGSIISYQEDKIYSVLPKDGTGDFTFSGGDGGTRVNQQGYIETTPANLFTYSNDFTNAVWGTGGYGNKATITPNALANPVSGVLDASLANFISSGTQGRLLQVKNGLQVGIPYTVSMYIKAGTKSSAVVYVDTAALGYNADFNLSTGTITSTYGTTATIKLITNGWYYVTVTCPVLPSGNMQYGILTNGADDGTLYIYGTMLNQGSTALPYQPTTDRLNYPRITYQNGRGALLSEPQRTNLALQSNTFPSVSYPSNVNGYYYYSAATLNSTNNLSPDGTNNAYNITMHNVSYDMYSTFTGLSVGTTYCYSLYVKLGSATNFAVVVNNTLAWNTVAGSQTFTNLNDTNYTRVTITFVAPSTGQVNIHLGGHAESITQQSPGDVYIWGEQFEAGTYPTSYIPTTSATVTRPQDVSGKSVPSIVNTSAGTLYLDVVIKGTVSSDQFYWGIYDGSGNQIYIGLYGIYGLFRIVNSYSLDVNFNPVFELNKRYKFAFAYQTNDAVAYMNGNQAGSDTSVNVPSVTSMGINFLNENANIESYTLAYFNTRLTNTQLAELTTVRSGSGGNISYYGPYTIHTFTGSATFTPSFTGPVEVLVVAGGGGGGQFHGGGGGGAGGLLYISSYGVSAGSGITVTVGSGGSVAGAGSNTVFGGLTAIGGGYGATEGPNNGGNGGSGGGGTGFSTPTDGGLGTPGQGFNGGKGAYPNIDATYGSGGGGGGASAPGTDGKEGVDVSGSAGNGGNGLPYSITGFSTYYAGGGGGGYWGSNLAYYGVGGLGGGGNGGAGTSTTLLPTPGVNGLGGGGGGSRGDGSLPRPGSTGGSGIVIVRYLT